MLGPIRKFSTSIYAKVLLVIMIIPFVFWGMGSQFQGGNKNVVVVIDKEKYSVEDFVNFIQHVVKTHVKILTNNCQTCVNLCQTFVNILTIVC